MKQTYVYPGVVNSAQLLSDRGYNKYNIETIIRNRQQAAPQFIKRLELETLLRGHTGCVNCVEWSSDGRRLASASDDNNVIIWDPFRHKKLLHLATPHRGNIFSVKFLPKSANSMLVTGAADSKLYVFDLTRDDPSPTWRCHCHNMRVKRLATAPEQPFMFWSAAEDGYVLQFDMRQPHTCQSNDKIVLVNLSNHSQHYGEVKCIAVNPRRPELIAVGAYDCFARLYDRRMISLDKMVQRSDDNAAISDTRNPDNLPKGCVTYFCPGHLNDQKEKSWSHRATTFVSFSSDGTELLVNMGAEQIYLYNINKPREPEFLNLPRIHKNDETNGIEMDDMFPKRKIPKTIELEKKHGNEYLEAKKYLQAINQYTLAIQKEPDCPVLYLNRATALMRRAWYGDVYAALKDCHTALKLDPLYIKAHFRLARALLELNHIQEASKCLEELKSRFPNYANNPGVMMLKKDIDSATTKVNNCMQPPSLHELSNNEKYWRSIARDYEERFVGHCNTKTDIKEANFFGSDSNYVIAGSDDGNFFIWERPTNMIVDVFRGDESIVNCVQPHPYICLLATSGIDHEVRLWSPQSEDENYSSKYRINNFDESIVLKNQQRMQSDLYDITSPHGEQQMVCRAS